jgi:hypothetical protein
MHHVGRCGKTLTVVAKGMLWTLIELFLQAVTRMSHIKPLTVRGTFRHKQPYIPATQSPNLLLAFVHYVVPGPPLVLP